jgi:hypothetical protein
MRAQRMIPLNVVALAPNGIGVALQSKQYSSWGRPAQSRGEDVSDDEPALHRETA